MHAHGAAEAASHGSPQELRAWACSGVRAHKQGTPWRRAPRPNPPTPPPTPAPRPRTHPRTPAAAPAAAELPEAAAKGFVHPFGVWRRRCMVIMFASLMALLSADQNLLAPNLTAAAHDFGLDEYQKDTYL
jgi:hypothetical protein